MLEPLFKEPFGLRSLYCSAYDCEWVKENDGFICKNCGRYAFQKQMKNANISITTIEEVSEANPYRTKAIVPAENEFVRNPRYRIVQKINHDFNPKKYGSEAQSEYIYSIQRRFLIFWFQQWTTFSKDEAIKDADELMEKERRRKIPPKIIWTK